MNPQDLHNLDDARVIKAIEELKALREAVATIVDQRVFLSAELANADSREKFLEVARLMSANESAANNLHKDLLADMGSHEVNRFPEQIATDFDLSSIYASLKYSDFLSQIALKKEQLDSAELSAKFMGEEKVEIDRFLNAIQTLEPISHGLKARKKELTAELEDCSSAADVDLVVQKITEQAVEATRQINAAMNPKFSRTVEEAIKQHLGAHARIASLIELFDFEEAMADSVMGARMRFAPTAKKSGWK